MPPNASAASTAAVSATPDGSPSTRRRRFTWAAALLGFALGGFFDGIVLHQILQWHHLLSAVRSPGLADLATQVLADGAFHAAHYVIALCGLWVLLRAIRIPGGPEDAARLAGWAAVGFGTWHVVDAVLSHWLLGIHRIRMDVPNPLFWDLLWLVVFGVTPIVVGLLLQRRVARRAAAARIHGGPAILAALTLVAGLVAARPPADGGPMLVVFARDAPDHAMDAVAATRSGLLGFDASAGLWILDAPRGTHAREFYARGARYAGRSPVALGCLSWLR